MQNRQKLFAKKTIATVSEGPQGVPGAQNNDLNPIYEERSGINPFVLLESFSSNRRNNNHKRNFRTFRGPTSGNLNSNH